MTNSSGMEPLVKCSTCESLVNVKHLSSHDCPLTQSNRFSQVSHYEDELYLPDSNTDKEQSIIQAHRTTTLKEIIQKRHSASESQKNVCSRCHHGNAKITIAQKNYHSHCFTCFICRKPFIQDDYKEFEGQIYCHDDFNMIITRLICATCEGPIESFVRPTIALDKYFHPEHIRCTICHKPVDPDMTGLVERKGKIYCKPDFNELFLPKCESCQKPIEKEAVISLDNKLQGKWHKLCFKCQLCNTTFPDHKFYVHKNKPYCRLDYHKLNNSLCHACNKIIEGHCIETAIGLWKFHPSCFTCHTCHSEIQNEYFVHHNHIYCQKHHSQ